MNEAPLGLFLTWTVHGTFLPGDQRGWRHRRFGEKQSQPSLESWHRSRLNHDVVQLDASMSAIVKAALIEICDVRSWTLWAVAVRTNHVHAVISAGDYEPTLVRDQLKSKATRDLREAVPLFRGRPVWSRKGDIEFLDSEDAIATCVTYAAEAQDRKGREQR